MVSVYEIVLLDSALALLIALHASFGLVGSC